MGLKKKLQFTAIAIFTTATFSVSASAQDSSSDNEDLFAHGEEEVLIVGAVRAPDEKLMINQEVEKHLSDIPETKDEIADKDLALLEFARSGIKQVAQPKPNQDDVQLNQD